MTFNSDNDIEEEEEEEEEESCDEDENIEILNNTGITILNPKIETSINIDDKDNNNNVD